MKRIPLIYFLLICACTQPVKKPVETFIIPAMARNVFKPGDKNIPPPSPSYYFHFNFIIDTGEHIFYYLQPLHAPADEDVAIDGPPPFINLLPKDLIEVPVDSLQQFVARNLKDTEDINNPGIFRTLAGIASTRDTIASAALTSLLKIFKEPANRIMWQLQKTTHEEDVVLDYKKRKAIYYPPDVWWDTTKILFVNDKSFFDDKNTISSEALLKFNSKVRFKDYPVTEIFKGNPPATLDFSSCSYGKRYKTAARTAADSGAVFAGHYAFATMGCGSSCSLSVIIDLKTGKVYTGPDAGAGYEYHVNSKILLVNPVASPNGLYYPCGYCTPEQYLWDANKLKRIY